MSPVHSKYRPWPYCSRASRHRSMDAMAKEGALINQRSSCVSAIELNEGIAIAADAVRGGGTARYGLSEVAEARTFCQRARMPRELAARGEQRFQLRCADRGVCEGRYYPRRAVAMLTTRDPVPLQADCTALVASVRGTASATRARWSSPGHAHGNNSVKPWVMAPWPPRSRTLPVRILV
jgi:hypothetical protein